MNSFWRTVELFMAGANGAKSDSYRKCVEMWWLIGCTWKSPRAIRLLTLSACLEGMWNLAVSPPTTAPIADQEVEKAISLLIDGGVETSIVGRVSNLLKQPRMSRTGERIKWLRDAGVIEDRHVKAFHLARHPLAHGDFRSKELDPADDEFVLYDAVCRCSLQLLQYRGKRIDYGMDKWPTAHFAPVAPRQFD